MNIEKKSTRYDRGARLHLLVALLLLAFAFASTMYRFTLVTDGWLSSEPEDNTSIGFIYDENVMGANAELQPGDNLVAVEGRDVELNKPSALWQLKPLWAVGNTVTYTVVRQGQTLDIRVSLVHWKLSSLLHSRLFSLENISVWTSLLLFAAIGFFVFLKRPDNPAARALLVLSVALTFVSIGYDMLPSSVADSVNPISSLALNAIITLTFTFLLPPAFIRFALVFPRPKPSIERHPWLARLPYAVGALVVIAFLLNFYVAGWIWTALSILISILILIHNAVTMRDAVSRAQMRWGLGGMVLGLGMIFLTYVDYFGSMSENMAAIFDAISGLGVGVMGLTLGMAILRYRLYDIDVIIRRTLSYSILTAILGLVYFGGVVLLQTIFESLFGNAESPLITVISTLAIAALFNPLRNLIQVFIDRRFFRSKYDAEKALADFAVFAREEVELVRLSESLLSVVESTMHPEQTTLWLRDPARGE